MKKSDELQPIQITYCIFTWNYGINHMDQCITK